MEEKIKNESKLSKRTIIAIVFTAIAVLLIAIGIVFISLDINVFKSLNDYAAQVKAGTMEVEEFDVLYKPLGISSTIYTVIVIIGLAGGVTFLVSGIKHFLKEKPKED